MSERLDKLHAGLQIAMREWLRSNLPEEFGVKTGDGTKGPDPEYYVEQTAMNMADAAIAVVECSMACRGLRT